MVAHDIAEARWFARVGLPQDDAERLEIAAMCGASAAVPAAESAAIASWAEASRILEAEERDSRNWDADEAERERLWELAADRFTEDQLLDRADAARRRSSAVIADCANAAARRLGISDPRFVAEAIAAAQVAVSRSELARLAGADGAHRFNRALALFVRGRWPLGHVNGRTKIF